MPIQTYKNFVRLQNTEDIFNPSIESLFTENLHSKICNPYVWSVIFLIILNRNTIALGDGQT